ncbi:hypothetical protein A2783_01575 [Microgenomates group bacterium RIFCSPHIGHO2_01_FULL_45_11]|nr:MAG: hypothetical protein A2783_01575 [Microgenomates group bacterium RIFCSPHIGHO2_01_FULL_45_11]
MSTKISILTPTYNHEAFISKCLDSVQNQTYKSWEQIVIDDASLDKTSKIAEAYVKRDKRIKVVKHKKNWGISGLSKTYNQALELATGEYIAILEGDDFWPLDKLEKQVCSFEKTDYILSFGDAVITNKLGKPIMLYTYNFDIRRLNNIPVGSIISLYEGLSFSIIPSTVIIKKNSLLRFGGFKRDLDYPFTDIPTFLHLSLKGSFFYQKEVLGFYRKHSDSSWFEFARSNQALGRRKIQRCINTFTSKNKDEPSIKENLLNNKQIKLDQEEFINRKRHRQELSNVLNQIAFKDVVGLKQALIKWCNVKSNNTFLTRIIFTSIAYVLTIVPLMEVIFSIRYAVYVCSCSLRKLLY